MKAALYTLGCKVNQYDTQVMTEKLINAGYTICPFDSIADVYIINTCTVTQVSDKKSRNAISRARRNNPDAIIVVCGCFSQISPEAAAAIDGVDIVIGTRNRIDIVYYIDLFLKKGIQLIDIEKKSNIINERITDFSEKTRAIIKIEDGCRNFCSYCLIAFARGEIVSKPVESIICEAKDVAKSGYKEIVLTGIHLSSYGKDLFGITLADAIEEVCKIDGIERVRLGSLEPTLITQDFISRIKKCNKLCPSFHLSLQSGCDKTLKAMNRKYTASQYANSVHLIRSSFEGAAITTDMIVGFPGETEADFEESRLFAEKISFSKIHIFPYSKRSGTKAATMQNQIPKQIKHEREKKLEQTELKCRKAFMSSMVGKTVNVLVERSINGQCDGFTDNYLKVSFDGTPSLCNAIVKVKIESSDENMLYGSIY